MKLFRKKIIAVPLIGFIIVAVAFLLFQNRNVRREYQHSFLVAEVEHRYAFEYQQAFSINDDTAFQSLIGTEGTNSSFLGTFVVSRISSEEDFSLYSFKIESFDKCEMMSKGEDCQKFNDGISELELFVTVHKYGKISVERAFFNKPGPAVFVAREVAYRFFPKVSKDHSFSIKDRVSNGTASFDVKIVREGANSRVKKIPKRVLSLLYGREQNRSLEGFLIKGETDYCIEDDLVVSVKSQLNIWGKDSKFSNDEHYSFLYLEQIKSAESKHYKKDANGGIEFKGGIKNLQAYIEEEQHRRELYEIADGLTYKKLVSNLTTLKLTGKLFVGKDWFPRALAVIELQPKSLDFLSDLFIKSERIETKVLIADLLASVGTAETWKLSKSLLSNSQSLDQESYYGLYQRLVQNRAVAEADLDWSRANVDSILSNDDSELNQMGVLTMLLSHNSMVANVIKGLDDQIYQVANDLESADDERYVLEEKREQVIEEAIDEMSDLISRYQDRPEILSSILRAAGNSNLEGLFDEVASFKNHPDSSVRLGVVKGLRRDMSDRARLLLEELAKDQEYVVSESAKKYLALRNK